MNIVKIFRVLLCKFIENSEYFKYACNGKAIIPSPSSAPLPLWLLSVVTLTMSNCRKILPCIAYNMPFLLTHLKFLPTLLITFLKKMLQLVTFNWIILKPLI